MKHNPRLTELLLDWQEQYDRGRDVPSAVLCEQCPELAAEVERQIAIRRKAGRLAREVADRSGCGTDTRSTTSAGATKTDPEGGPTWQQMAAAGEDEPTAWLRSVAPPQGPGELARLGQFAIRRPLGAGGMGAVFVADDTLLHRAVAVKIMRPHLAAAAEARERFLREARAAAKLDHERVVPIYHVGEAGGVPFLVMRLLSGESLETRLRREPRPRLAEVLRLGREVAEGLSAAHAAGLVHRDVKPANIWLKAPVGSAVLLDFGLARATEPGAGLTVTGAVIGTPAYMAPEQADGRQAGAGADLFSLGAVLYQATTGQRPFAAGSAVSVLHQVVHHQPPPPRELQPRVPATLSNLIMKLLAKDPAARPPSAEAVADRLAAIQRQLAKAVPPANARGVRAVDHRGTAAARPVRRRVVAAVVAIAAAALMSVAYLYGGVIVRFATNTGEVVIETDGPGVEVTIRDGTATVYDKVKDRRFVLTAGEYELDVREDTPDGLRFGTKKFTLARGGKAVVTARLEPAKKPAAAPGPDATVRAAPAAAPGPDATVRAAPAADADRKAAEWALSVGCTVTVGAGGRERDVNAAADLPGGSFQLVGVNSPWGNPRVTDDGLRHLRGLPHLRDLTLILTPVTDAGLAHLRDLPRLTNLHLHYTRVTGAGLAHLRGLTELAVLTLGYTRVDDPGLAHLGALPKLRSVDLSGTRVTDAGLAHLEGAPSLTTLWLCRTGVGDAGLRHLAALANLEILFLGDTRVTDAGLAHIEGMPKLVYLFVNGTRVTAAGLARLRTAAQLRTLGLDGRQFDGAGPAELLLAVPNLTGLALIGGRVRDAHLARLKALPQLTYLDLSFSGVTDEGLTELRALPELNSLVLNVTGVTDAGLAHVTGLNGLRRCELNCTRVTAAGAERLRATLPDCQVLWSTSRPPVGRPTIEWVLSRGGTVRVFWGATHHEVETPDDLPDGPLSVYRVSLRGRQVADVDLPRLRGVPELDLSGTAVTDAGLKQLATPGLIGLSLANTAVTDAGVDHLRGLAALRDLDLTGTGVTEAAAARLRKALPDCQIKTGPSAGPTGG